MPTNNSGNLPKDGTGQSSGIADANYREMFDSFVRAAIWAIELRDPTASGHAFRVAALTRGLGEAANTQSDGPFAAIKLSTDQLDELELAGLLHDVGKVAVREEVLVKAKKLYPPTLKMIRSRFDFIKRSIENDHLHRRLMMVEQGTPTEELAILDSARERAVADIEECWRIIASANEPTMLPSSDFEKIEQIASRTYFDLGGHRQPYLEPIEMESLLVAKGSINDEEIEEIRGHASHTIQFLERIPWGNAYPDIIAIAGSHHERLDGSGYPKGLTEEVIPFGGKMMAIADIFDAMTAADRPYKKAITTERALDILRHEAKSKHIDTNLVELFISASVYKSIAELTDSQD